MHQAEILNEVQLGHTMNRLAHQIIEPYDDPQSLALIGMQTRGVHLAQTLQELISEFYDITIPLGVLDVTFYRDDFRTKMKMPSVQVTDIQFDLFEKNVVLVDDVLFTGRTIRAAMDAIMSFGRAASVKACCLIDRGHRELPIHADYIGMYVPTHLDEEIQVKVKKLDGENSVYVVNREDENT